MRDCPNPFFYLYLSFYQAKCVLLSTEFIKSVWSPDPEGSTVEAAAGKIGSQPVPPLLKNPQYDRKQYDKEECKIL